MRVIAGAAKGRTLVLPKGGRTRPATDRIREALFATLEPDLPGARVLDLFAGAGTLGIEALSRGAAAATFVERDDAAVGALRRNLAATGLADKGTVVTRDVLAYLGARPAGPFDIAFADPPYADVAAAAATLAHPGLRGALTDGAVVIARAHRKHPPALPPAARVTRVKEIGEDRLLFLSYGGENDANA